MRPSPEPKVVAWLDQRPASEYWLSAVTVAEIGLGIALLPDGKRKAIFAEIAAQMLAADFAGRCFAFDQEAALAYAAIVACRKRHGAHISVEDAQIAAIAVSQRCPLATRNAKDFTGIDDLIVINPWNEA
jgi:predicted nucleic acid-binding protein